MFRFNTHDRRLERSMEVALMLMEAFRGFESKFAYRIIGHSGDGANIEFVTPANYPKTEKDEFDIISKMRAHSQYCLSGGIFLNNNNDKNNNYHLDHDYKKKKQTLFYKSMVIDLFMYVSFIDNTLGATAHSIKQVVEEEGDDYFVVVLSDANITQYNIHPKDIAKGINN